MESLIRVLSCLRSRLSALVVLLCLAGSAQATWSIIAVNTRTKEICVSSATCLTNFDLRRGLPVIVVGRGAGCAQSFVDTSGQNRQAIFNGLQQGIPPAAILQILQTIDPNHQTRQYGIVDMDHAPITFTGTGAGLAKFGVTGVDGEIVYAIQGNVLTGNQVILDAEAAFLALPGDLTSKVIAAMEAARLLGGDGRCSCSPGAPTSCGVPPQNFLKTAHVGFFIDARLGDTDGTCNASVGCATGNYTLNLNVIGNTSDPDPIQTLGAQYQAWRGQQLGRPDGVNSLVYPGARALPADGRSATTVTFLLQDIEGLPVGHGGAAVTLTNRSGAPAVTTPGTVIDHGDGSYSFTLTPGLVAGEDHWEIRVDDGIRAVSLAPFLRMRVDALADLHCGFDEVSAAADQLVPLTFNLGPAWAGKRYILLAGGHGTTPGTSFLGAHIPLNPDHYLRLSVLKANTSLFENSLGVLDANGYAQAGYRARLRNIGALIGGRLDFCGVVGLGVLPTATGGAGFDVKP